MRFTFTILALVLIGNVVNAQVTCDGSTCKAAAMPLLHQVNPAVNNAKYGTGTCTPTSSGMVVEAFFDTRKDEIAGSFAASLYQQSAYGVVNMLAEDMRTSPSVGTYSNDADRTFKKIATGMEKKTEGFAIWNSRTKSVDLATVYGEMQKGSLGIISFGMYVPKCSTMASDRSTCSFQRSSGHSVAVQSSSATQLAIFDPNNLKWNSALSDIKADSRFKDATLTLSSTFSETTAKVVINNYGNYTNVGMAEVYMGLREVASTNVPTTPTQPTTPTEPTTPSNPNVPKPPSTPKPAEPQDDVVVVSPKVKIDWEMLRKYYIQRGWIQVRR